MKNKLLLLFFLMVGTLPVLAQISVSGVVIDGSNSQPFAFASVYVKGATLGTTTDIDGNYTIDIPSEVDSPILVFQFMGYSSQEIKVNNKTEINVTLNVDAAQLDEVVVTSFGIKRERKALNYAVQDLKSDELAKTKESNIVNSLRGKVAGVQVTSSSGSPGASSQILIRGSSSVSSGADNQPLFVVDGVIISNATSQGGGGNGAMDIDPDDIESMTVLKGPAAAALYGWAAANGAIVITTKSGKAGRIRVDFGTDIGVSTPFMRTRVQDKYMQGTQGYYSQETPSSWGPLLPENTDKFDNVGNFLGTGVQQKYNLSVTGGSNKLRYLASGNYIDQTGVVPTERYKKLGGLFKLDYSPTEKLRIGISTNIVKTNLDRVSYGFMKSAYRWPINRDMREFEDENGDKIWLIDGGESKNYLENPYWWTKYNSINSNIMRTITNAYISWDFLPDFNFSYRLGYDHTKDIYSRVIAANSAGTGVDGYEYDNERLRDVINSNLIISFDKELTKKINVRALVGHSVDMVASDGEFFSTNLMTHLPSTAKARNIGVFGSVGFDYDDIYFLEVTGRNDWSSTLSPGLNSFFYPSVTFGAIVSEYFSENLKRTFSYLKLRANYAQVGKATGPEKTRNHLEPQPGYGGGYNFSVQGGNWYIKPERTKSYEFGFETRLWNGKTHFDFTYYYMNSFDQIITGRVSPTSGFVLMTFNAGNITNKGIEIFLNQNIIETNDFKWDLGLNFAKNQSILAALPDYMSKMIVTSGQVYSAAKPSSEAGYPTTGIDGVPYLRNKDGEIVIDEKGLPRYGTYVIDEKTGDYVVKNGEYKVDYKSVYLGNREPNFTLGISNNLTYKNWDFSFLLDYRNGGDVINATAANMTASGMSYYVGDHRNKTMVVNGVVEQTDGKFVKNTLQVPLDRSFYNRHISIGENYVEDGSWFRLRNIRVGYTYLPKEDNFFKKMSFALTANNLWMWTKYSGGDPETNYGGSGVGGAGTQGLDYYNTPSVTSVSFNLKVSF